MFVNRAKIDFTVEVVAVNAPLERCAARSFSNCLASAHFQILPQRIDVAGRRFNVVIGLILVSIFSSKPFEFT